MLVLIHPSYCPFCTLYFFEYDGSFGKTKTFMMKGLELAIANQTCNICTISFRHVDITDRRQLITIEAPTNAAIFVASREGSGITRWL
jgi:hypothetical protein